MKKLLPFTVLFLLAFAGTLKAQLLIGGNLGFSIQKYTQESTGSEEYSKFTSITVLPRIGYVFGNNWAGVDVGISSFKEDDPTFAGTGRSESTLNLTTISPFFRFVKKPSEHFGVWIEASAGASFGKGKEDGTEIEKYLVVGAGLRPGILFFVSKNLSFEASFGRLGFTQSTTTDANNEDNKEINSNFGLTLNNNQYVVESFLGNGITISNGFLFGVNWMFGGAAAE